MARYHPSSKVASGRSNIRTRAQICREACYFLYWAWESKSSHTRIPGIRHFQRRRDAFNPLQASERLSGKEGDYHRCMHIWFVFCFLLCKCTLMYTFSAHDIALDCHGAGIGKFCDCKASSLLVTLEISRCDDVSTEFDLCGLCEEHTRSSFERSI